MTNTKKPIQAKLNNFGETVRILREKQGLLLRQAAAFLEVDTAFISKMERGEKKASRQQIIGLAKFLQADENELVKLWLCDRIIETTANDPLSIDALKLAITKIKRK